MREEKKKRKVFFTDMQESCCLFWTERNTNEEALQLAGVKALIDENNQVEKVEVYGLYYQPPLPPEKSLCNRDSDAQQQVSPAGSWWQYGMENHDRRCLQ